MIRRLLLLLLLVSLTVAANATRIQISEPECPNNDPNIVDVTKLLNGFSVAPTTTPLKEVFYFCNRTGVDWTSLLMEINMVNTSDPYTASQIECGASAFAHCTVTQKAPGIVDVFFFGAPNWPANVLPDLVSTDDHQGGGDDGLVCPSSPALGTGVPNNCEFIVDMRCPDGKCIGPEHWLDGTVASGFANVPEPSSMALIISGLGTWILRRKWSRI